MIGKSISHYKIVRKIGQGGMGVVYEAEDTKLGRTVALKFLPQEHVRGEEEKTRFFNEARAAAALDHPNICTVYEIDETDGQTFISMAYIEGRELSDVVREGPMKLESAVGIATQIAQGLEEAHERGITHRDIKGANVMITSKGRAMVTDFGLAKQTGQTQLTQEGATVGTIAYMSPEQARGDAVDQRTDIWSLGVLIFEMITGRLPFKGAKDGAIIYSIMNEDVEPLTGLRTGVPMELERIVNKCLAKDTKARYQHVSDLLVDLRGVQKELGLEPQMSTAYATAARPAQTESLMGLLMARRVPLVLLIYAVASFAVWKGLQWLVNNFPMSPHLPDFGLVALISLVPTVLLVAYFHGNGAHSNWTKIEGIGIPANLIASAVVLFMLFQNRDLGAATTTVSVTDDQGNTVERVVPKSEFRKRVAAFYPDNNTGDPAYDWLQYGILYGLMYDLSQDLFVTYDFGFSLKHKEAGFPDATGSPLTLKKKIASEYHYDKFYAGAFVKERGELSFDMTLYEADKLTPIVTHKFRGDDLFGIVDSLSLQIRRDIGVPEYHIKESTDLPASEMVTRSADAMRLYVLGHRARLQESDYEKAAELLEEAIAIDPSFAPAHRSLHYAYINLNRPDDAERAIESAMKHRYKLPESQQFDLLDEYYDFKQQVDERLQNALRWVKLYPSDKQVHFELANIYETMNRLDDAIAERETAFELDPGDFNQLRQIGRLYEAKGAFDTAFSYYERYAAEFPENYESFTQIGDLYTTIGEFDKARDMYKKALVIDPDRMHIRTELALVEIKTGNFDEALAVFEEALKVADSVRDSVTVLRELYPYATFRGQMQLGIRTYEQLLVEASKILPPVTLAMIQLFNTWIYADAGREEEALEKIREIESNPMMSWIEEIANLGYLIVYAVSDDSTRIDEAKNRVRDLDEWLEKSQAFQYKWNIPFFEAFILRWEGESEQALEKVKEAMSMIQHSETDEIVRMNTFAGQLCREIGSYELGVSYLEQALVLEPYLARAHYEMALSYDGMGQRQKALSHLNKALYTWENADPDYRHAKTARDLHASWNAEGSSTQ